MCSICRELKMFYKNPHNSIHCPYSRACYCSFCSRNGHTTTECPFRFCNEAKDPNGEPIQQKRTYEEVLEVVDMEANIRAFLLAYGIPLSGRPKDNRARLEELAGNLKRSLRWIDPETGETKRLVDGPRKKK